MLFIDVGWLDAVTTDGDEYALLVCGNVLFGVRIAELRVAAEAGVVGRVRVDDVVEDDDDSEPECCDKESRDCDDDESSLSDEPVVFVDVELLLGPGIEVVDELIV